MAELGDSIWQRSIMDVVICGLGVYGMETSFKTVKCPLCDEKFETLIKNKKFCCYSHRVMAWNLVHCKEPGRLEPVERKLRDKLKGIKVN